MNDRRESLKRIKETALLGGGQSKIDKQHKAGKLAARERIDLLLDPGTFFEWNMLLGYAGNVPAEGIVTGVGEINGKQVCLFSQDATVLGGSMGHWHGSKMYRTIERALEMRVPLIGTRIMVIRAFKFLRSKARTSRAPRKPHGNIAFPVADFGLRGRCGWLD